MKAKPSLFDFFPVLLRSVWPCFCVALVFFACESAPAKKEGSLAEAQAAAQRAQDIMDGKQPASSQGSLSAQPTQPTQPTAAQGTTAQGASSAKQEPVLNTGKNQPAWVNSVDSVYNRNQYVAAAGSASNRDMAERNALSNLIAIFGQSIYADQIVTNTYQEVVKNGKTSGYTDSTAIDNTIRTSASMDILLGAEIREVWYDSKNTYYAVAVLEKTRTARLYSEMITANQNMIKNLIAMSQTEKNSMEGFSRYQFAAAVADINISYGNLLKIIGATPPGELKKGDDYRLEAVDIAKTIPIGLKVQNDKAERIQGAFAEAIAGLGFRSGGVNSPYLLDVNITTSPVELASQTNKFTRIELKANLMDSSLGTVLFPFNFNDRQGHVTQSEADNRAYAAAEKRIKDDYAKIFSNYISQLIPKK
jgi:hypothetical protein